jgi:purine-binding chemotaxis protein CheW
MDAVSDVTHLATEQIKAVPAFDNPVIAGYLLAMGVQRQGDKQRMILLMDIERLMASADIGVLRPGAR